MFFGVKTLKAPHMVGCVWETDRSCRLEPHKHHKSMTPISCLQCSIRQNAHLPIYSDRAMEVINMPLAGKKKKKEGFNCVGRASP